MHQNSNLHILISLLSYTFSIVMAGIGMHLFFIVANQAILKVTKLGANLGEE